MRPLLSTRKKIDPAPLRAEAQAIVTRLARSVDPVLVICFGSVASGLTTDQSDIDLLVVIDDDRNIMEARRAFLPHRKGYRTALDLVWMKSSEFEKKRRLGGIAMIADTEGIVLYERGDGK